MGRHDPDNRSDSLPESRSHAETPEAAPEDGEPRTTASSDSSRVEPKPAAAGSLMSVQIRRARPARPRAPGGPAPCGPAPRGAAVPSKPALGPASPRPAAQTTLPTAADGEPRRSEEITAYWTRLRGNRPYPAVSDLDSELIATDWPNSILFRCRAGSGALMPDMSFLPRQDGGNDPYANTGKIQLSPMMLQWLVSLAEDAVRNRRPVQDTESFPSALRAIGYRATALPLSDDRSEIDHVLCHVKLA
jgi:hypothetical protein